MHCLVVYKLSNLELHGASVSELVERGLVSKNRLADLQTAHDEHHAALWEVEKILREEGHSSLMLVRNSPFPTPENFDLIVTVGGDGTLLSMSHHILGAGSLIGICSSSASVGYTTAGRPEVLKEYLKGKGKWTQVSRFAIEKVGTSGTIKSPPVLNDVLFAHRKPGATTRYSLNVRGLSETQKSSGIWISTGLGSTSAIAAAGGVRLEPASPLKQYRVRELYRPHANSLLGGTFSPGELEINSRTDAAVLAVDGQHLEYPVTFGDCITILNAPSLNLATPRGFCDRYS